MQIIAGAKWQVPRQGLRSLTCEDDSTVNQLLAKAAVRDLNGEVVSARLRTQQIS